MPAVVRTICCRLIIPAEHYVEVLATMDAFATACNIAVKAAPADRLRDKFHVQRVCYKKIREDTALPAALAIAAIRRASASASDSEFASGFVDCLPKTFRYHEAEESFGITLLGGRLRFKAVLGDFQREALKGRRPTSAHLVYKSGDIYLHVQVKDEAPPLRKVRKYLGVDLGIANIATDSEGEAFSGAAVEKHRKRRATARKQYQRKGTKNANRRLKRMAGRQRRYQAWVNHNISKRLVEKAKALKAGIALEDLSGIRDRLEQTVSRRFRRRLGNWGFFQLRQFVEYKAARVGLPVVLVNPRNTSRTCGKCGHCEKANRKSQSVFRCKQCQFSLNADFNAALNISAWAVRSPAPKASDREMQSHG